MKVYCNDVISSLESFQRFVSTIKRIVLKDSAKGDDYGFSDSVLAIDLDNYESSLSGANHKTMDSCIGVSEYLNGRETCKRLLLIEFRLNYTNKAKNSTVDDMKRKDAHSRGLLSGNVVDEKSYFVFEENVAPIKKNEISRKSKTDTSLMKWEITSPDKLQKEILFKANCPYIPISDLKQLEGECRGKTLSADYLGCLDIIAYWLGRIDDFYHQHNLNECKSIIETLEKVMSFLDSHLPLYPADNVLDYKELCSEELDEHKNRLINA